MSIQHIQTINAKINSTNNGKLMLHNLTADERKALPALMQTEFYVWAKVLNSGDSIRIGFMNPMA